MSSHDKKDALMSILFEKDDSRLLNMKFFRGSREIVSDDDIYSAVHAAFAKKAMNKAAVHASMPDALAKTRVEVKEFVQSL